MLIIPSTACAIGTSMTRRAADFVVTVDSTWAGGSHGGYFPIRLRIQNRGATRTLTARFVPVDEPVPVVQRTLDVPQNATLTTTLSIPCVSRGAYGRLELLHNGRVIPQFTETLDLPDPGASLWPSLLIISEEQIDPTGFEAAASAQVDGGFDSFYGGFSGMTYGGGWADYEVVDPSLLPASWVDYSGLDLAAIELDVLDALDEERRSAILDWVHTGGTLLVHEIGPSSDESADLERLLNLSEHAADSPEWTAGDVSRRRRIIHDPYSEPIFGGGYSPEFGEPRWPDDAFRHRNLLLGRVYAFEKKLFPAAAADWWWLVDDLGWDRAAWTARHGTSARQPNMEFLEFLIPSVRGVPVVPLLVLISLFAFVIGPLNYFLLWRKGKLHLLVLTVPAIALATSIALFAYSAVAHGFGVRSRIRSVTVLDQRANTAVTTARAALYAGLAPSDGLRFSPTTAVYPVWSPTGKGFQSGQVDWTAQQHWESGWLPARTRTQFLIVSHRDQRGRVELQGNGSELVASNGLEWDIAALVIADANGRMWFAENLAAGAAVTLEPLTQASRNEFARLVSANPPQAPAGLIRRESSLFNPLTFDQDVDGSVPQQFEQSMLERNLDWLSDISSSDFALRANSYAAVLREDPDVDVGLEETRSEAGLHVLMGYF